METTVMRAAVLTIIIAVPVALGLDRGPIALAGQKAAAGREIDWPDTFDGPITFDGPVIVDGPVKIDGPTWVYGTVAAQRLTVCGPLSPNLSQDRISRDRAVFHRGLTFDGPLTIHGPLIVDGRLTVNGPLWCSMLKKTSETLKLFPLAQ